MKTNEEVLRQAEALVSTLESWHLEGNRGPLAKLRRGLSETSRHEADFVLGQYFGPKAVDNIVFRTVAGCFALYPVKERPGIGNFGSAMRRAMGDQMAKDDETHARFRRLLACNTQEEICRHIPHAVRLAKAREAPVDYRRLFVDLWWWGDRVKIEWTKAYWETPPEAEISELAGAGAPVEEDTAAIGS